MSLSTACTVWQVRLAGDTSLVLAAAGLVIDDVLRAGRGLPCETDLETHARSDPAFVPELRRRLGAVPSSTEPAAPPPAGDPEGARCPNFPAVTP
jgi:hypothetical protein